MSDLEEIFDAGDLKLQKDSKGTKLFINGKEILTRKVIRFRVWEFVLLVMTAIGAFSSGVMAIISYFHIFSKCIT